MTAENLMPRDPMVQALTAALASPFEPRDVKYKPQMVKNNRCLAMAYIDARLIQDRLDEVLGVENWEDAYRILPDGSVMCRLRVKLGDRWITKTDVGSPSEQPDGGDRLKAAFSDALKRAAVKFGIGRYLYRLPAQWVNYDPVKKQIAEVPQMPAFGIPKKAQASALAATAKPVPTPTPTPVAAELKREAPKQESPKVEVSKADVVKPQAAEAQKPEQPKQKESPKPEAPKESAKATNLPANGQELHRRLREYETKLVAQKVCSVGQLLSHVTQAGIKAGYSANMSDWTGPALPFAVDAVREFELTIRQTKGEPRNAA